MLRKTTMTFLLSVLAIALGWGLSIHGKEQTQPAQPTSSVFNLPELKANEGKILQALGEMNKIDLEKLVPIEITPFQLPGSGVDIMRVKIDEHYRIDGIGEDTVELTGWVAVAHTRARPAFGEKEVSWETAISDTEFVGMDLRGHSEIFGPVQVSIDHSIPPVGAVGKLDLSFMPRVSLDLAYSRFKPRPRFEMPAETVITRFERDETTPQILLAANPPKGVSDRDFKAIESVLRGVWKAIGDKNPDAMLRYFSKGPGVYFNSGVPALETTNAAEYVRTLSRMFKEIKSIQVIPNDDLRVRVRGDLAVVSVTGRNEVVDMENHRGSGPWRWTVELAKENREWVIVGDHLSFFDDPKAPLDRALLSAAKCVANVSVAVVMPQLDLRLTTKSPVSWYSEVQTIPPVGETASVSVAPTPMVTDGREVGTLTHGWVKFREVVRHIPLDSATDEGP